MDYEKIQEYAILVWEFIGYVYNYIDETEFKI